MKHNKRIKLLKSQKILLQTKREELTTLIQAKNDEFREILDVVIVEQGIPERETRFWYLAADGMAIEKMEPKKPPKKKKEEEKK